MCVKYARAYFCIQHIQEVVHSALSQFLTSLVVMDSFVTEIHVLNNLLVLPFCCCLFICIGFSNLNHLSLFDFCLEKMVILRRSAHM